MSAPSYIGFDNYVRLVNDKLFWNALLVTVEYVLINIGLQTIDGEDVYIVFGELSAQAPLSNVIEEILVLADNTLEAAEAFADELN